MATLRSLPSITDACVDGAEYFNSFATPRGAVEGCNRGDWLLWLFKRTNPGHHRLMVLAAGRIASTVRHLMQYNRSIAAIDMAMAYGNGEIECLRDYRGMAMIAVNDASFSLPWQQAAAQAAYAATSGMDTAALHAVNALASYAEHKDYAATRVAARQATADIFRSIVPIEVWDFSDNQGG